MKRTPRFAALAASSIALSIAVTGCSAAGGNDGDSFPPSQIEVIVPWSAGGGSDQATRQLLLAAEDACDTRFVVANRTGAAGATGHEAIAGARPDGHTLGTMTAEAAILPHTDGTNVTIDSFVPIMRFAAISPAFVVQESSDLKTIDDLVESMENNDEVRVGTTGRGGVWDIAAGGFANAVDAEFTARVPYDGGAAIIQAILGGHIEVAVLAAPEAVEQVKAGELRVLAVASEDRADVLPDVPTLVESDIDWSTETWFGIAAPAEFDAEQVSIMHDCLKTGYDTAEYQEFLANLGFQPGYQSTEDFTAFIRDQNDTFASLIPELY